MPLFNSKVRPVWFMLYLDDNFSKTAERMASQMITLLNDRKWKKICHILGMLKKPMIGIESDMNKYLDMSYPF